MIRPIQYIDYDKISDDILYLGSKLYLRMNVSLSNKDGDSRYHFHKEFNYNSGYAEDDNGLVSIKRSFMYYLTFDKTDEKVSIMIRPQDMILLQNKLKKVSEWFENGTFGMADDKIVILKKRRPITVTGLPMHKYLQFDPVVISYDDELYEQTQGIQITLGDPLITSCISVDNFFGLLYTLQNFSMFQSAQNMINYLGRPEFGTNLLEIKNDIYQTNIGAKKKKKKTNEPEKNNSYFQ